MEAFFAFTIFICCVCIVFLHSELHDFEVEEVRLLLRVEYVDLNVFITGSKKITLQLWHVSIEICDPLSILQVLFVKGVI